MQKRLKSFILALSIIQTSCAKSLPRKIIINDNVYVREKSQYDRVLQQRFATYRNESAKSAVLVAWSNGAITCSSPEGIVYKKDPNMLKFYG